MDNDTLKAVQHCMDGDPFARRLGTQVEEIRPGFARARLKLSPELMNFVGVPHGAVVFAVADQAFAAACNSRGTVAVALNVSISFLAAAAPDATLVAEAEEIHCGSRTSTYHILVKDDQGRLIANFQGLAYRKKTPIAEIVAPEDSPGAAG